MKRNDKLSHKLINRFIFGWFGESHTKIRNHQGKVKKFVEYESIK